MNARIDRIENNNAVIVFPDVSPQSTPNGKERQVLMPMELLPKGAREGSFLTISVELDPQGEQRQREKIGSLLDKLRARNTDGP